MKLLNDVDTYEDDYGNTKQLVTEDHSPSQSFSCNKPLQKKEIDIINKELKDVDYDSYTTILSCKQELFPRLLSNSIWAGMILYDDVKDAFSWNKKLLDNFINNRDMTWTLSRFINKLNDEVNVTN